MLPSWIRSRNCRPRLVYFLAMEITRRRFASTISFLARRALASPIDMARLISLMSVSGRNSFFSIAASLSCSASIASRWFLTLGDHFWRLRESSAAHSTLPSLLGKVLRNSALGIFTCLTKMSISTRSWWRMSPTTSRSLRTKLSISADGSLSLRNSSAIWSQLDDLLVGDAGRLRGGLLELGVVVAQQLHAALDLLRIRTGRTGLFLFGGLVLFFVLVLVGLDELAIGGRFLGLGARLVGQLLQVGEAGQDFRQAALAVQVLVVFLQQQLDGQREAGQRGLHL